MDETNKQTNRKLNDWLSQIEIKYTLDDKFINTTLATKYSNDIQHLLKILLY